MCRNNNTQLIKFGLAALTAIILGIIAGVLWPDYITSPIRFLLIALITSASVLVILSAFLLSKTGRNNQASVNLKNYIRFQLLGAIGTFITSVIGLSVTLTTGIATAVLIGFATGFFVLLLAGSILVFDYLTELDS